jgi:hypothetical protein
MNDVVAYESFSKSGRTLRSEAIPCVSSETGALRAISPPHFPPGSAAAETLQIARTGGARLGFGFAKLRLDVERAWQTVMHLDCREALVIAELIEHDANRLPVAAAQALRCEIAALRAVALVLQDDEAAALPAALSALGPGASARTAHVASTVCRSVYWRLGDLERFYAVERVTLDIQPGRLQPVSVPFDLALDAAVALDQMRLRSGAGLPARTFWPMRFPRVSLRKCCTNRARWTKPRNSSPPGSPTYANAARSKARYVHMGCWHALPSAGGNTAGRW